jgi:hypothetical protein
MLPPIQSATQSSAVTDHALTTRLSIVVGDRGESVRDRRGGWWDSKTDESRRVLVPDFVAAEIKRLPSRFAKAWLFVNQ